MLLLSRDLQHEIEFMKGLVGDPEIDSWQVPLPQLVGSSDHSWMLGKHSLSFHQRSYWNDEAPLVNAFAAPDDRAVAEIITGKHPNDGTGIEHMIAPRRGVLLVYPIKHEKQITKDFVPTMGLSFLFPRNQLARQIGFEAVRPGEPDASTVDA